MYIVVLFLSLLAIIPIGYQLNMSIRKGTKRQLNYAGQADNIARAGIVDALSWFKRQTVQPVSMVTLGLSYPDEAFSPQTDLDPKLSDTIDPAIGLVKEYQISGNVWARYEVRRQALDNLADPGLTDPFAAHDVTSRRIPGQADGSGLVWEIHSRGIIFRSPPYDPKNVIATSRVMTEFRRVNFNLPNAAAVTPQPGNLSMLENSRILGGSVGAGHGHYCPMVCAIMAPFPGPGIPPVLSGNPDMVRLDGGPYDPLSLGTFFGITFDELKQVADISVRSERELPTLYPAASLVFIDGAATFTSTRTLVGGGVLVVRGPLRLSAGAATYFNGVIYVTGYFTIRGDQTINGSVISEAGISIHGYPDLAQITYDQSVVDNLPSLIGAYRQNRASTYVFSGAKQ